MSLSGAPSPSQPWTSSPAADVPPPRPRDRERRWIPLLALSLGYFMVILDATAVTLTLPAIARNLGAGVQMLQWVVDSYTIAFASLMLNAGAAVDRLGPRRAFMTGLAGFILTSVGCGLAPDIGALIALRLLQGAAAALVVPGSLALLQANHPDPAERARAVGFWGGVGGMAAASGPVLGGALTTLASWRLVFTVNVPVGLLALWLTRRRVAAQPGRAGARLDPSGQVTVIIALSALTSALIEAGSRGLTAPLVLGGLALAATGGVAFVAAERLAIDPMLPLNMLRRLELAGGAVIGLLVNLGLYGQLFVFSLYLQQARGDSPLGAGLALLPEAAAVPLASIASGWITGRAGPRAAMMTGLLLGAAGLLGLAAADPGARYAALLLPMIAAGSGTALAVAAATTTVLEAAPAGRAGTASGILNSSRQVGSAIGVAVTGGLVAGHDGFMLGLHVALFVTGSAFLIGAGVTAALPWRR